jgi:hypothetical protein
MKLLTSSSHSPLTCTLTLIGATSIINSAVAQAFSPTTTGVIVILTAKAGDAEASNKDRRQIECALVG